MITKELNPTLEDSHERRIAEQTETFKQGFPPVVLLKSATLGDGIRQYNTSQREEKIAYYQSELKDGLDVLKFVPASGAATRMFKHLFEVKSEIEDVNNPNQKVDFQNDSKLKSFVSNLQQFAFYQSLKEFIPTLDQWDLSNITNKQLLQVLNIILTEQGLNYGALPKGVILFHHYNQQDCTPLEEHLYEAAQYAKDSDGHCHLHFTVSPEHQTLFEVLSKKVVHTYEERFKVKYHITFSTQKISTNTLAVNPDNTPFLESDGSILFRPGGHGALIENLNDLDASLIFIKNIDNVTMQHLADKTVEFKQVLAGTLLMERDIIHSWIEKIQSKEFDPQQLNDLEKYIEEKLCVQMDSSYKDKTLNQKQVILFNILNRPIRVCGMVKNEGEPGGGPYWAKNNHDIFSLQIIESSQINHEDPQQESLINEATHFNPVDLVCYTKDQHNQPFDLTKFVDPNTGFISNKSKNGKKLKALELPGLWNGAMANWSTIFVEVPLQTFSPVKEVTDLFRKEHQL
ncbi:DUF4301 family protein [Halosquirtibacter laminarini]|uniref:DUF4301 family protein n=1 Tax=Halosquirtibacter laminarini TaxID=3374600 RepID=A0AC61NJB5_9BACT|nr:DUF4301 family protein [Prolixibacteraceae bacterium]